VNRNPFLSRLLLILIGAFVICALLLGDKLQYPAAPRENVTDDYHGIRVADPYRWLENPDSPRSRKWIEEENALTNSFLANVPNFPAIKDRLASLWTPVAYPSATTDGRAALVNKAGRYFFMRRDSGNNQPILYWMLSRDATPKPLLDPNRLSADGTAALLSWAISNDGKLLAYGIARSGSDWQIIYFRDVDTGRDLADKLEWSKFIPPEWASDNKGIYYARFPKPADENVLTSANYNQQLCFHKLRTQQTEDTLIYERPDHKDWLFQPRESDNGRYLIIHVSEGTRPENLIFYRELGRPGAKTIELINKFEAVYKFLGNRGSKFYFLTTAGAPKGRVVVIDVTHANAVVEVVPQTGDVLDQAVLTGQSLYLVYAKDVSSFVVKCGLDGMDRREIELPGMGHVLWAERLARPEEQFFSFEGFAQPETLYSLNTHTWRIAPFEKSKLPFDPESFETRQIFYMSKDGTRIPMFLVGRKGFEANPNTPCLLWGYGGFDISTTPQYRPLYLEWIELGGIFASANLRGGGEYGEEWHKAGMQAKKQNVFDDFIAAAEWLIANKYTSRNKLAIYGRSNGGLLVGAVLNQRPDLFGAAIAGVGVMDMLRFPKFTIGHAWTPEYGSPDNPVDFKIIRAYSPLHNIREGGEYPPTLVLTSDHDDRVVPAHSFKYAAELQYAQAGPAPVLIRIETSAGHGAGKPITKQVEEAAAVIAFLESARGADAGSQTK
jgi:prolyl oligopeptidase